MANIILVHISGSKAGLTESYQSEVIHIGREPDNDIQFDPFQDLSVSGYHAKITKAEEGWEIVDLGSSNGTYVNEVAISEVTVDDVMGVAFTSTVSEIYRLQCTESPASGMWTNTPLMLEGTGGPITAFDPTGVSTQKSYRILQL